MGERVFFFYNFTSFADLQKSVCERTACHSLTKLWWRQIWWALADSATPCQLRQEPFTLRWLFYLIEHRSELCPDETVDQKVDGRVDHKEYVREEPGHDGHGHGIDGDGDEETQIKV